MITIVVPTRNRAHTLRRVAPSYFAQQGVTEIIFVSDAGSDETPSLVHELATRHPAIATKLLVNDARRGASHSRNVGVAQASNEFVLFCDDDEALEEGYAQTCLDKLLQSGAGAVSGRRIYLEEGESHEQALRRFGNGIRRTEPFRKMICEYVNAARFEGDINVPLTNAVILTRRALLQRYPYDPEYARGNGYREESDYQMNLFVHGHDILVTNERHSFHLPMSQVRTGGQRAQPWVRAYWSVYYTRYFFRKYYADYARRVGLRAPRRASLLAFAAFAVYRETLRPPLYAVAKGVLRARAPGAPRT